MPNELSEKVYPDGTVAKLRDDTAREQIANITDGVDVTKLGYINNVTSDIQAQINGKQDALETKYLHYISIQRYNNDAATIDVTIPIINNTAATMTKTEILTYLDEHEQRIKPIHGMYHSIYQGNFILPEPIVDFIYTYYEGSEDKRLIFYRFENDEIAVTSTNSYLRIEDRFVVQIVQSN